MSGLDQHHCSKSNSHTSLLLMRDMQRARRERPGITQTTIHRRLKREPFVMRAHTKQTYICRAPNEPPNTTMVLPITEEECPAIGGGPCVVTMQFHLVVTWNTHS